MMLNTKYQGSWPCYIINIKALCFVVSKKKILFLSSLYNSINKTCDPRWGHFLTHGHYLNKLAYVKHVTSGQGHFWPQVYNLNKLGRGPLGDAKYQISIV